MLRPYQEKALTLIRGQYLRGIKRVLLQMPTGSGKTVVFSEILKKTKVPCLMVVRGRKLVDQASNRLSREGVFHGIYMAGRKGRAAPIQVCSIDTLHAREKFPDAKFIVIDEVHMATSQAYKNFLKQYPQAHVLGVTATPYMDNDLSHAAQVLVRPITARQLIEQGYLVPGKYYCPSSPDTSGVKVSRATHDYAQDQLALVMQDDKLVGDIIEHWKNLAENRPTLVFAVTIAHSKYIVERFRSAGISAEHCDADTKDQDRERIVKDLETGKIQVISNVGIFCTGVDIPCLSCIVMARPTKSYSLYMQQLGRGTRVVPGKTDFLILDHANNVRTHGRYENEDEGWIDGANAKERHVNTTKICRQCFLAYEGKNCPACGVLEAASDQVLSEGNGKLVELQEEDPVQMPDHEEVMAFCNYLWENVSRLGYKDGYVWHKLKDRYGEAVASLYYRRMKRKIRWGQL